MREIDYVPVGKGGRHGDAIAMRFTQPGGDLVHVIIDAGFEENGEALVDHVRRYYNTNAIDLAIVTHPDGDHIGRFPRRLRRGWVLNPRAALTASGFQVRRWPCQLVLVGLAGHRKVLSETLPHAVVCSGVSARRVSCVCSSVCILSTLEASRPRPYKNHPFGSGDGVATARFLWARMT